MAGAASEELERFRQQWQEEVISRNKGQLSAYNNIAISEQKSGAAGPSHSLPPPQNTQKTTQEAHNDWEYGYHDPEDRDETRNLGEASRGLLSSSREPTSALEHYERAVERETEGSLGDSLNHYRKAYKVSGLFQNILMCYTD